MPVRPVHPAIRALSSYTEDGAGCWVPNLRPQPDGYVRLYDARTRTRVPAHRVVWEYVWGLPIPDGLTIDHLCKNRACMRPDHLEPVTMRENLMRGTGPSAANARKDACLKGHPFSEENTLHVRGERVCRACNRECTRAYKARIKTRVLDALSA